MFQLGSKLGGIRFGGESTISGDWILATGFWNDSGIWDDSAVWID